MDMKVDMKYIFNITCKQFSRYSITGYFCCNTLFAVFADNKFAKINCREISSTVLAPTKCKDLHSQIKPVIRYFNFSLLGTSIFKALDKRK